MTLAVGIAAFLAGIAVAAAFFYRRERILGDRAIGAEKALEAERANTEKIRNEFRLAAQDVLQETRKEGSRDLEVGRQALADTAKNISARLEQTEGLIRAYEKDGKLFQGTLEKSLSQFSEAAQKVEKQALSIKQAMTSGTSVRGSFGQMVLETILEENGLQNGIHYDTQVSNEGAVPDFVVYLPGENRLAIDAKELTGEFLIAQDCEDEAERKVHYLQLAKNIKTNFVNLAARNYQDNVQGSLPFIVMFVSNEAAMRTALATDPSLFEEARRRKIYLASPMTIVPMIQLIRLTLQQQTLAENAEELGRVVEDLGSRLFTFIQHLQNLQKSLSSSVQDWDKAIGSWENRITPQLERVRQLGGKFKDSPELSPISKIPRIIEKTTASLPN